MLRCPICKNRVEEPADNSVFPFCSERCKLIDLGNWLGEGYRIPDDEGASALGQDPAFDEPPARNGRSR